MKAQSMTSADSNQMTVLKLSFLAAIILLSILVCSLSSGQTAIKVTDKTKVSKPAYTNTQGFKVPGSVPDTCKVYQGSKGGKFVYRQSKKTGKVYKSYLKF
jgi:hypothetical protein